MSGDEYLFPPDANYEDDFPGYEIDNFEEDAEHAYNNFVAIGAAAGAAAAGAPVEAVGAALPPHMPQWQRDLVMMILNHGLGQQKPKRKRTSRSNRPKKVVMATTAQQPNEYRSLGDFSQLPGDVIFHILHFFSFQDLRMTLVRLNKGFAFLSTDARALPGKVDLIFLAPGGTQGSTNLLKALSVLKGHSAIKVLHVGNHKFGSTTMKKLVALCPNLEEIDFTTSKKINRSFADLALDKLPYLKAFTWDWAFDLNEDQLVALLAGRKSLLRLKLRYTLKLPNVVFDLCARHCENLQELTLDCFETFSDESVDALIKGCRHLRKLRLAKNNLTTRVEFDVLTPQSREKLLAVPNLVLEVKG